MIGRRDFITLLGGAAAGWPLAARAQQPERVRRVGMLIGYAEQDHEVRARVNAFEQALQELGWTNSRNVQFTYRWERGDAERMRLYAAELLSVAPDVVLTATTSALAALRRETRTVPIVFVNVTDPVGSGFVARFARTCGNITGFSSFEPLMGGKWVQLLKEVAPRTTRIALMSNPDTDPQTKFYSSSIEVAAASLSMKLVATPVHDRAEIESGIAALGRD